MKSAVTRLAAAFPLVLQYLLFLSISLPTAKLGAQVQNISLVAHLSFASKANDIWGYTAPDGTEYALVGLHTGVSIVSLAEPALPKEVAFIPGEFSTWRDLRTYGSYCYVVADQPGTREGVLVIDLSGLPDQVSFERYRLFIAEFGDTLFTSHNIWIDEFGYAYLSGSRFNTRGVIFLDLFSQPGVPQYVGKGFPVDSHDCYARDNKLYVSEIAAGQFSIYDITDKNNVILEAIQETPFRFSHNVWLSDNSSILFNTDERANAPVAAYDISDISDIRLLDAFTPPATRNTGVIPHNVHVLDDFLVISHYTDGCVIVDASRPTNLVQVGWYDTNTDFSSGFHGAWGAYPFFPSGLVVISDIENGLFVLQPEYKRACWLEGKVRNALTEKPLAGATVLLLSDDPNRTTTNNDGQYKTGQPTAGTFTVRVSALGYFDKEVEVQLTNGQLTTLDVALEPFPEFDISGLVREAFSGEPLAGILVAAENELFHYTDTTGTDGRFSLRVKKGNYDIYTGGWGFTNGGPAGVDVREADAQVSFTLQRGYEDAFNLDLGWEVSGNPTDGQWERGIPKGTTSGSFILNPDADSPNDFGPYAFISGNQGVIFNDDDLDGGPAILTSPPMALLSCYEKPQLYYETWFSELEEGFPANDTLVVLLDNGADRVVVEMLDQNVQQWRPSGPIDIASLLPVTDNMRLILSASDFNPEFDFFEVGLDNFNIEEAANGLPACAAQEDIQTEVWPNPFSNKLSVRFRSKERYEVLSLALLNAQGQLLTELTGEFTSQGVFNLPLRELPHGVYFLRLQLDGRRIKTVKVVK